MSRARPTRRAVLRAVGGTLAAGLSGVAGCLAGFPGGGDRPSYEEWLPSQAALGIGESFYSFTHLDVGTVVANRDRFDERGYDAFADAFGAEGAILPPVEAVDGLTVAFVSSGGSMVLVPRGSFEADVAAGGVTGAGFEGSGEHGGFDLYTGPRGAAAVRDGRTVLCISGREDATEWVRTFVDAGRGEAERLAEADADAERLVEELGTGLNVLGFPSPSNVDVPNPGSLAAAGRSARLDGDAARFELVFVYDDAESVDVDAVNATATDEGYPLNLADARSVSASSSGRIATVSGVTDVGRLDFSSFGVEIGPDPNETPPAPPQMAFGFEYDEAAGTVTITMEGGETFTGEDGATLVYSLDDGTIHEWQPPVSAGDSVTLQGVESGDTVLVVWESAAGDRSVLAEFTVP